MSAPTIAQQRLFSQGISQSNTQNGAAPRFQSVVDVVGWLGALQAQDRASGDWTIGLRLPGATAEDVEQAFAQREIVRTWLLRGTLHVVAASDLHWMLALLGPRLLAHYLPFHRKLGLDDATLSKGFAVMTQALQDGNALTRKELLAALAQAGIVVEGLAALNLVNRAALEGIICLGVRRGKQDTFVLLDEWLPSGKRLDRDEALAELALRYFTSHGPTTLRDFVWWTGLHMPDARAGFDAIRAQLIEETVEGKSYWRAASLPPVALPFEAERSPAAYLLPGFDEFVLGYAARSDFLHADHASLITGTNAIFAYTMVLDGRVVGKWKRTPRKHAIEIELMPFDPLPEDALPAFAAAAQRYGDFMQMAVTVL